MSSADNFIVTCGLCKAQILRLIEKGQRSSSALISNTEVCSQKLIFLLGYNNGVRLEGDVCVNPLSPELSYSHFYPRKFVSL